MKNKIIILGIIFFSVLAGTIWYFSFHEGSTGNNINGSVDFGSSGYVYVRSTILSIDAASAPKKKYEYIVRYPGQNAEKVIYSSEDNDELAYLVDGVLRIKKPTQNGNLVTDIALDGQVKSGPEMEEKNKNIVTDPILSPDAKLSAYAIFSAKSDGDAVLKHFEKLTVEDDKGQLVATYLAKDFSDLPALIPVAFSPDSRKLLISSTIENANDIFTPHKYFLQTIGGLHNEVLESPVTVDGKQAEINLIDFVGDELVFGEEIINSPDATHYLLTYNLTSKKTTLSDQPAKLILDVSPAAVYFMNAQNALAQYSPVENTMLTLSKSLPDSMNFFGFSKNKKLFAYFVMYGQSSSETRGGNNINATNKTENVMDYYIYDIGRQIYQKIFTDAQHLGGDRVGDIHYHFFGFVD